MPDTRRRPLTDAALRRLVGLLPESRTEWGRAMLAELETIEDARERSRWALGVAGTVVRTRVLRTGTLAWLAALAAAAALLLIVDRSPSDVANQAAMLLLLTTAGLAGFASPRAALLSGLILGSVIAVAHLLYQALGVQLAYQSEPAGFAGALTLFVLVIPGLVAAGLGALLRRQLFPPKAKA